MEDSYGSLNVSDQITGSESQRKTNRIFTVRTDHKAVEASILWLQDEPIQLQNIIILRKIQGQKEESQVRTFINSNVVKQDNHCNGHGYEQAPRERT